MDLLDERLIIVAAPAGYGKTSLLVDLASQTRMPFCWYTIDSLDRDFKRFVTYLLASISYNFPKFGKKSALVLQNVSAVNPNYDQLITTIVNEAYEVIHEHFAIVLDDYHFINEVPEINQFLGRFIQEMDENCHVIISSRTLLTLPDLPLMVARSQVGGLGLEELSFRIEEIRALLQKNYRVSIPDSVAHEISRETEGWITGLLLSTQSKWQGVSETLQKARVSSVGLYEYLAQQVLDQQSPQVRDFLLRTSPIEEFDAELCSQVLGPGSAGGGWHSLIDLIQRNNLFVLPVGEKGQWLRYHHLFRDFLHNRLTQENPVEETRILRRLADVYAQRREWERAHALYQRLGRTREMIVLIEAAGSTLLKTGRMTTLAAWIDELPSEELGAHPALLSLRGGVALMLGEVERGLVLLNHAEEICRRESNYSELVRTLSRRAHAHRFQGDYTASLRDADEAVALARNDPSLRSFEAEALRCRGLVVYRLGRAEEAIECLKSAAGIFATLGSMENEAVAKTELGIIYRSLGQFAQARLAYEHALAQLTRAGDLTRQATVLNNLGVLHHYSGEYQKASSYFEQSLLYAEQSGYNRMAALTLSSIGDLYRDLDAPEAAQNAYEKAEETAVRINDQFLLYYLDLAQCSNYRIRRDLHKAQSLLEKAREKNRQGNSPYERGILHLEAGRMSLVEKNPSRAIEDFQSAANSFDEGQQQFERIQALVFLAAAYTTANQSSEAGHRLLEAFHLAEKMGTRHTLIVSSREMKHILKPEAVPEETKSKVIRLQAEVEAFEASLPNLRRRLRLQSVAVPFAPPKLTIRALGRTQLMVDGKPVSSSRWQSQAARDFLLLLLAHPEGLTKDEIVGIFWPDSTGSQIRLLFKNTIYRVRHALEQEVIILEEDHYRFNHGLDYDYDVENFLSKLNQAQVGQSLEKQIAALKTAVHTYKGPYLPEVEGTWVLHERERLHQAYIGAMLRLVELFQASGDSETALTYCMDILGKDPCLEEAHRQAMQIYASLGNKVGVVRQYERCEQILLKELNLGPSPQTLALFERLTH
jgi:ATP/maltotriose-dependent transcriptional regulator MalT/DNA-binding SARP family transcriptional activator